MKKVNNILMDKKVINLIDNVKDLMYDVKDNEMLIINIFNSNMTSFAINTKQYNNSYVVINFAGFINKDGNINIESLIEGDNNHYIINFHGIASSCHGTIKANVHVKPGTKNNEVKEDLKGILEEGTLNFMPILEIDTSEVKAEHYATIGHYPLEELFYLQTKGISKEEAIKILKKSFLFNLFDKEFLKQINYGKEQDE